jgi:SNF2 family DNA or RNA helicase/uncharacterized Zn finger protein
MSHEKFGKTNWGKKWIEALESIDRDTNRLGRGKTYARNHSVKDIQCNGNLITAKVQGSRNSPYSIKLELTPYSAQEKKRVETLLKENPGIFGEFSVGKISETVSQFFDKNQIHFFPDSWDEMKSTCSCPDWANPCKHRAAVYYLLANEIDKNPALLLEWRGIDLKKITGKTSISSSKKISSVLFQEDSKAVPKTISEDIFISFKIPKVDVKSFFESLDDNPLFYEKENFRTILKNHYLLSSSSIENLSINENVPKYIRGTNFWFQFSEKESKPRIFVDNEYFIRDVLKKKYVYINSKVPVLDSSTIVFNSKKGIFFSIEEIIQIFLNYPLLFKKDDVSESGKFISHCLSLCSSLIASSSFLPQLEWVSENEFKIVYHPLFLSLESQDCLKKIQDIFQPYFGYCLEKPSFVLGEYSIQIILKYFLDSLFRILLSNQEKQDKIHSVFFTLNSGFVPEVFQEEQIGKTVENWLERFSNFKDDVTPLIKIDLIQNDLFSISLFIEKKNDPTSTPIPISDIFDGGSKKFLGETSNDLKLKLIRQILLAGEKIPELIKALNSRGKEITSISIERMGEILIKQKPLLEFLGIRFILPKVLLNLLKPTLKYQAKSVSTIKYIDIQDLQNFKPVVLMGEKPLTKQEIEKLKKNAGKLIPFRDGYVLLDPKEIDKLFTKPSVAKKKSSKMEILFALLTGIFDGTELEMDENYSDFIKNLLKIEKFDLPRGLKGNLRPYQKIGYEWMYSNLSKGINPLIADDMGLGKTIQVITVLQKLKEDKKLSKQCLVVCPMSLLGNWKKEIERFSLLSSEVFHGNKKAVTSNADIIITTYGNVRASQKYFSGRPWDCLVIDEAQNIKNPLSDQSQTVKSIKSNFRIAMSGTPVENRLTELWSIFDFTNPEYLGTLNEFKKEIAIPIERYRDEGLIKKLRTATSPFLLRRLKTDKSIITDLPEKIVINEYPALTKEQELIYSSTLESIMNEIESSEGITRRGLILKLITSLKQICNHPSHFTKKKDINYELSGKTILLFEILEKILEKKEKILLFTQYSVMGSLLQKMISHSFDTKVEFFEGSKTKVQREKMIKNFQEDDDLKILIISLKAGGTGLNLVNANNVIHFDLWWNPAVEEQATDRAFRIGQKKNVQVYRMVTLGTFEEKIDDIMKQKRELANLTVAEGEKWITEMSDRELKDLFKLKS